jgi:hypothetical protein
VTIPQLNIVSADAVLINGDRKQEILERARSDLEEEILEQIWRSFDNIREFGSLVRVEERIDEILENHRDAIQASGQVKFTQEGSFATQSSFVSGEGEEESWGQVKDRLLEEVSELASEALDRNDPIEEMFAGEVGKTVELLDVLVHEYDVVVSNPPYLSSRKMGDTLKDFLKDNFAGYRNIYTCFIERCAEISTQKGYATLVTPQDFMTLYSFRKLRNQMVSNHQIIEGAHLAGFSFSMKDRPFTIPFVLRQDDPEEFSSSRFFRLTHEQDAYDTHEKTIAGLNNVTECIRSGERQEDIYVVDQNSFKRIDRQPFVYWFGQEILELFLSYKQLGEEYDVVQGLGTGDDDRFTRNWWEIKQREIGDRFRWLLMSGDDSLYYYSPERVVLWENSGKEIKQYDGSRPQNTDYYDNNGITFRRASKNFTARIKYENDIFSYHSHFINSDEESSLGLLGYLCSSVVRFILDGLNPGLDFNVGDGKRIPLPAELNTEKIKTLTKAAVSIQKRKNSHLEIKREFKPPMLIDNYRNLNEQIDLLEADIMIIHGLVDDIVNTDLELSEDTLERIYDENPDALHKLPHITNSGHLDAQKREFREEIPTQEYNKSEFDNLVDEINSYNGESIRTVAEELEISPYTVAKVRSKEDLYTDEKLEKKGGRLVSFIVGSIFDRWENPDIPSIDDEILVLNQSANSSYNITRAIDTTLDSIEVDRSSLTSLLGKQPEDWLENRFFRHHHCKEYRRRGQRTPIYWQLESPNGAFSCFVYYHEIDTNTLPKLRGQYLDPRIDELENELETLNTQTSGEDPDKALLKQKEEVQNDLDDIREFRDTVDEMIDDSVTTDIEKGIWENIKEWDQYKVLETGLPKLKSSYSR